jgi:hypothetical protein
MSDALTIGRLTIRLGDDESPEARAAHRRRALAVLDHAALTPRGLPPQALLIVRRLQDPDPRALFDAEPLLAAGRWGDRARDHLDDLWRTAARPAREPVPSGCEAVWFADRAEWLACLSLDLHYGIAQGRWYWWTWFQRGTLARDPSLAALWHAETDALPMALAQIAEAQPAAASELVASLTVSAAHAILHAVAAVYALKLPETGGLPESVRVRLRAALPSRARSAVRALTASERESAPDADVRRDLLVIALAAAHVPALTQRLLSAVQAAESVPEPVSDPPQSAAEYVEDVPVDAAPVSDTSIPESAAAPVIAHEAPDEVHLNDAAPISEASGEQEASLDVPEPFLLDAYPAAAADGIAADVEADAPLLTSFGGAFYLINLIQALELTAAADAINPWIMVYLLAEAALGDAPPDPLWGLLLDLAGDDIDADAAQGWLAAHGGAAADWLAARMESFDRLPQVIAQPARLYVTRTHIDVYFALDQIDLELRLIGLDRDPGWLPAFGRVVLLHYE